MRIKIEYNDVYGVNIVIEYGNIWKELEEIYRESGYVKRTKPYLGQSHLLTCYTWLKRTQQINTTMSGLRVGIIDDATEPPILTRPLTVNVAMLRCIDADSPEDNPRLTLTTSINDLILKSDLDEMLNVLLRRLKIITNRRMRYEVDMKITLE